MAEQREMTMQEYQLQQQGQLFHKAHRKTAEKLAEVQLDLSLAHAQVEELQSQVEALLGKLEEYEEDVEEEEPVVKQVPNREQRRKKKK